MTPSPALNGGSIQLSEVEKKMLESQGLSFKNLISHLLQQCKNTAQFKQIHAQILLSSPLLRRKEYHFLISRLLFLTALSNSGSLGYATGIFHSIKYPNLPIYNIMIRAYATHIDVDCYSNRLSQPLILYKQMLSNGISPDCLTFPFLIKECTKRRSLATGGSIQGQAVKLGLYNDLFVRNSLLSFYSACGFVNNAKKVFDEMLDRDVVSLNSMIIGYLRSGDLDEALDLFREMKDRNIITWNSIITGLVQGGRPKEALEIFHEMQCLSEINVIRADKITIASVLSACASLGAIDHGKWVHSYLKRSGLECDMVIGTALVDMYGKSGCLERAYEIFRGMSRKDTLAWTAMISVLALHGYGEEAFDVFKEMQVEGVKPNHVTFVGLLSACAHSGFVELGRWCFYAMKQIYSVEPQVHHYACMVDLLGRAGLFEEAEEVIRNMPMKPDVYVWGALLGGCQMHGNVQLGEKVARYLIDLEPQNHAFYVNLCDIYAKAGKYTDAKNVRTSMKELGIQKEVPGCSMIEINGFVLEFSVMGSPNVMMEELVWVLTSLSREMKTKWIIVANETLIEP